jgi:type I restriction enzyme, S subunit
VKRSWQTKSLGEVLEKTATTNPLLSPDDEFDYIDVSSVSNEKFQIEETQRLMGKDAPSRARRLVLANDILFATIRPTLQRIAIVPENLDRQVCSTGYFVLRPSVELDHRFLFYWLFTPAFMGEMEARQKGASYPAVNDSDVRDQIISFPPLAEQQRIVGILDDAFDGIATAKANAEKNLQNARALFESHLQSVFAQLGDEWGDKQLGEVADIQSGGTPSISQKAYWGGEIAWYSSGELNETYTQDPERTINDQGLANSNAKLFAKGSLLIGMYDTAALKMSILDRDGAFNQAIAGLKPNDKINAEFVLHAINADKPRLLLERRGVRQKNLSLGKIKEIMIPLPSFAAQCDVVRRLCGFQAETQRLESLYQRKLTALDELKKSLLHQAFSGAL